MEAGIEKHLGSRAEFDRFSTQLQDLTDAARKQVFALRNLAQKFQPEEEAALNAQDLNLLHQLSRKHTAVLAEKIEDMEHILVPTLSSLGGTAVGVHPASHANWQPVVEDLSIDAQRVDILVSQMLGLTQGSVPTTALPSDLLAALKDLHANLDDCQKLLK